MLFKKRKSLKALYIQELEKPKFDSFTSVKLYKTATLANKTLEDRKRRMCDPLWRTAYVMELKVEFGKICTYR